MTVALPRRRCVITTASATSSPRTPGSPRPGWRTGPGTQPRPRRGRRGRAGPSSAASCAGRGSTAPTRADRAACARPSSVSPSMFDIWNIDKYLLDRQRLMIQMIPWIQCWCFRIRIKSGKKYIFSSCFCDFVVMWIHIYVNSLKEWRVSICILWHFVHKVKVKCKVCCVVNPPFWISANKLSKPSTGHWTPHRHQMF